MQVGEIVRLLKRKSSASPYSSFSDGSLVSDFPATKILFHADDYTAHATTWTDRAAGIVATLSGTGEKDSQGVYTLTAFGTASGNGWMEAEGNFPTLTKYAVCVAIGVTPTTSATAGLGGTFGETDIGPSLGTSAVATAIDVNTRNSIPTINTPPTTVNKPSCVVSYFDLVDTSSPQILRAIANNTDNVIGNGSTTTTDTLAIGLGGAITSDIATASFQGSNDGRRIKLFALLEFTNSITLNEIQLACVEMARTQELFAGWRNKT